MEYKVDIVKIEKPENINIVIGQAHFIKTIEDLYEACVTAVPGIKCGIAFCEASGPSKVRLEGTQEGLKALAAKNAQAVGAGHTFFIVLEDAFPVNILNAVKSVPEVCRIFCATANPLEVIVAQTALGRGILGVVDGESPKGIEEAADIQARRDLLRKFGYKR